MEPLAQLCFGEGHKCLLVLPFKVFVHDGYEHVFLCVQKLKIKSIKTILTTNFDIVGETANEFDLEVTIPFFFSRFLSSVFYIIVLLREMTLKNRELLLVEHTS